MKKTVAITGAGRGIGLEFCKQYLEKNFHVYALCRSPENSPILLDLKKNNDSLSIVPLDITQPGMVQNFKHTLGDNVLDIIVNNAGIYGSEQDLNNLNTNQWLSVLHTNTIAPIILSQQLLNNLLIGQDKKIVMITSKMGSIEDNKKGGSYFYRSSKAALNSASKSLAIDLQEKKIIVAVLHPGWVKTDMGGTSALLSEHTSVSHLINVIDNLSMKDSGNFINYDGSSIPW